MTVSPRLSSICETWLPMKPAAPVTRIVLLMVFLLITFLPSLAAFQRRTFGIMDQSALWCRQVGNLPPRRCDRHEIHLPFRVAPAPSPARDSRPRAGRADSAHCIERDHKATVLEPRRHPVDTGCFGKRLRSTAGAQRRLAE